ncbi:hypothetical protein V8E54_002251 [Elaphomyces granulatus]
MFVFAWLLAFFWPVAEDEIDDLEIFGPKIWMVYYPETPRVTTASILASTGPHNNNIWYSYEEFLQLPGGQESLERFRRIVYNSIKAQILGGIPQNQGRWGA